MVLLSTHASVFYHQNRCHYDIDLRHVCTCVAFSSVCVVTWISSSVKLIWLNHFFLAQYTSCATASLAGSSQWLQIILLLLHLYFLLSFISVYSAKIMVDALSGPQMNPVSSVLFSKIQFKMRGPMGPQGTQIIHCVSDPWVDMTFNVLSSGFCSKDELKWDLLL